MTLPRIPVVFSDSRPGTTGVYCVRALEGPDTVRHVLPEQLPSLSGQDADLFLRVDDSGRYPWPPDLRPCAA